MKKRFITVVISVLLIMVLSLMFVACDDKEDKKPASIQLTENTRADEILNLLPQIKNMTYEFVCENDPYNFTYRMKISKDGYILQYIYETYEETYVVYLQNNVVTLIHIELEEENCYKDISTISDDEVNDYDQLTSHLYDIKLAVENQNMWRIEDGKLIIIEPNSTEAVNHEITFKDFNCSEMNFEYYLSLNIPVFEDEE